MQAEAFLCYWTSNGYLVENRTVNASKTKEYLARTKEYSNISKDRDISLWEMT